MLRQEHKIMADFSRTNPITIADESFLSSCRSRDRTMRRPRTTAAAWGSGGWEGLSWRGWMWRWAWRSCRGRWTRGVEDRGVLGGGGDRGWVDQDVLHVYGVIGLHCWSLFISCWWIESQIEREERNEADLWKLRAFDLVSRSVHRRRRGSDTWSGLGSRAAGVLAQRLP